MTELLTFAERLKPGDRVRFRGVPGRHKVESVVELGSNKAMFVRVLIVGGKPIDCPRREFVWVSP